MKGISRTIGYGRIQQKDKTKIFRRDSWNSRKNYSSGYERVKLKRFEISCSTWRVSPSALIPFIELTAVSNLRKRQMPQLVVLKNPGEFPRFDLTLNNAQKITAAKEYTCYREH